MIKLKEILESDIEHTVGNALFAIETNLAPLIKRIQTGDKEESLKIIKDIQSSVEKAKQGLLAWKNRPE